MRLLRPATSSAARKSSSRTSATGCAGRRWSTCSASATLREVLAMEKRIYAGAGHYSTNVKHLQGGLFRTSPGKREWQPLTRGLPEQVEARAFAVDPRDPNVVFVGTQDGPYRTTDGGEHWERTGFPDRNAVVWSITFHPTRPN